MINPHSSGCTASVWKKSWNCTGSHSSLCCSLFMFYFLFLFLACQTAKEVRDRHRLCVLYPVRLSLADMCGTDMHNQLCSVISLCFGHQTHDCQRFRVSPLFTGRFCPLHWVHETIFVLLTLSHLTNAVLLGPTSGHAARGLVANKAWIFCHCIKGLQDWGMKSKWGQCCTVNQSDQRKKPTWHCLSLPPCIINFLSMVSTVSWNPLYSVQLWADTPGRTLKYFLCFHGSQLCFFSFFLLLWYVRPLVLLPHYSLTNSTFNLLSVNYTMLPLLRRLNRTCCNL